MRFLALFSLLLMVWATPIVAQADNPQAPRGLLTPSKKTDAFLTATPEQLEEALQVTQVCKQADFSSTFFDCDCVGMKFLENRQIMGDKTDAVQILALSRKSCPNAAGLAGSTETQCQTWAAPMRPRDFKPFCACFANRLGRTYEHNPSMNEMVREAQMTEAFRYCDGGAFGQSRIDRDNTIRDLIKNGLYEKLFPSAAKDKNQDDTSE